jgi:predicted nucleic-acid-binding Zn-ribbon protein
MQEEMMSDEFSSIDVISCPHCGTEAMVETVHATGEENIQCHNCGYSRRMSFVNGSFQIKEQPAFGAYKVEMLGSPRMEAGSFANSHSAQEFEKLMKNLEQRVAYASYSQYINGEIVTKVVIDKTQ